MFAKFLSAIYLSYQDIALRLFSELSLSDRKDFLRSAFDIMPEIEGNNMRNLLTNALKRKKRARLSAAAAGALTPDSALTSPAAAPAVAINIPWWSHWKEEDIVAIDVESVKSKLDGKTKPAIVAIVDHNGEKLLHVSKILVTECD